MWRAAAAGDASVEMGGEQRLWYDTSGRERSGEQNEDRRVRVGSTVSCIQFGEASRLEGSTDVLYFLIAGDAIWRVIEEGEAGRRSKEDLIGESVVWQHQTITLVSVCRESVRRPVGWPRC